MRTTVGKFTVSISEGHRTIRFMKCQNCGNTRIEHLDFSIIRFSECTTLFDPNVHPDFSEPTVDIEELWDTSSEDDDDDWVDT